MIINLRYTKVNDAFGWVTAITAFETFWEAIFESIPQICI